MKRNILCIAILSVFCFLCMIQCGIFEPEEQTGSMVIILKKTPEDGLRKTVTSLSSAQCIVKKGFSTVYDQTLYSQGGYFNAEIKDLEGGSDYSVLMYGKDGASNIIARAYTSPITIEAGKQEPVEMSWIDVQARTVTDIDGNVYQTKWIGYQIWMTENLKVTRYRNGDAIPNVTNGTTWESLTSGAYCNYNNDVNNVTIYGRLYNWYTVNDSRNIAPAGWHVPSDAEWQTLVDYLGGDAVAGGKMKETGYSHWQSPNTGATNTSGFSGLPGGYRYYDGGFYCLGYNADFWSSSEDDASYAWSRSLDGGYSDVPRIYGGRRDGFSIRLVRDY